jgi:CrcB protein
MDPVDHQVFASPARRNEGRRRLTKRNVRFRMRPQWDSSPGESIVEIWTKVIVLSVGGTLGVNARYWLGVWINRWTSPQFPWATVFINVSGSFMVGFLTVALARWVPHPNLRLMLITGFLGGYTTFSTFENDALTLWERGEGILMAANLIGSVAAGFAAVLLGSAMARGLSEAASGRSAAGSQAVEVQSAERMHAPAVDMAPKIPANHDSFDSRDNRRSANEGNP